MIASTSEPQIILAISGRKGAGKNTVASFIGEYFAEKYLKSTLDENTAIGRGIAEGYIRLEDPSTVCMLVEEYILECSFADKLKEFCMETLGLSYEQCYGTDEEKNQPTEYRWEEAPDYLRWKFGTQKFAKWLVAQGFSQNEIIRRFYLSPSSGAGWEMPDGEYVLEECADLNSLATGFMTGREIMQMVGTDLVRQTFGNVWAAATIRHIQKQKKTLSLITDNRFPNEIETVLEQPHGYIIRLTRSPYGQEDVHPSESSLDDYDWNKPKCFVLDNANMTISEQNEAIEPIIDLIMTEFRRQKT